MNYIMNEFRKHSTTQELLCKQQQEMQYMADTYRTYLESQRNWKILNDEYHAKGERTISQTAKMVGFNLPHEPKILRKPKNKK